MKRILCSLILVLSLFLVGCQSETTSTTQMTYNPNILVELSFDMIPSIADDYHPVMDTFFIDDIYQITEVQVLASAFQESPYEWQLYPQPQEVSSTIRSMFNEIRTDQIYENQMTEITNGYPGQAKITLENTTNEEEFFVIEIYKFDDNTTSVHLYFYNDEILYFYHNFDQLTEEVNAIYNTLF